ncbi:MAG: hypothetical protein JXL67_07165, partial [Calditrichaeota bacterium]|nr:hypothetical protein [Calditrichota bacterium]
MAFFNQIKNKSRRLQQNPIFFWISLIFLNVLLFLPQSLFYSGSVNWFPLPPLDAPRGWYDTALFFLRRENQDLFRLVAEYFIIISLLFLAIRLWKKRWIERILIGSYIFFLLYNFYDSIMILLFGESPILYNDLMMLKGAFYLLIDISLTRKLFEISGILLLCALILALIPFLFQSVIRGLEKRRYSRKWAITFGIGWIFIIIYTFWFKFYDFRAIIHWITPKIVKNVQKSISLYTFLEKIEKKQADSTYYSYREIKLERHPDIYLFMLESYGRVLIEKQELRTPYLEFISEIEGSLNRHGWGMQSTFSRAPISGGRSWLSMGSLINGINMKDEAVYSYFINKVDNYPNLVHFLNLQG